MTWWRRSLTVRRWRLDIELYRTTGRRRSRWTYAKGGQATPGPWWALYVLNRVALTLSHDRTLFGWDDGASKS